mmetsp:Transcript_17718/g.48927  ORF Transcript_17718/g.48927 Transcript_17718/m.48927 type:complete len:177 (-) Transcript_17718:99-629(-)
MAADLESSLAAAKERIIIHMNDDHADSLLAYARHYAQKATATVSRLQDLSVQGLTMNITLEGGKTEQAFVPFTRPLGHAGEIRKIVVEMHHEAYNALGFVYKLRHGYYGSMLKHAMEGHEWLFLGLEAVFQALKRSTGDQAHESDAESGDHLPDCLSLETLLGAVRGFIKVDRAAA